MTKELWNRKIIQKRMHRSEGISSRKDKQKQIRNSDGLYHSYNMLLFNRFKRYC